MEELISFYNEIKGLIHEESTATQSLDLQKDLKHNNNGISNNNKYYVYEIIVFHKEHSDLFYKTRPILRFYSLTHGSQRRA